MLRNIQFSLVQSLDWLGHRGDDLAEILFQSTLQEGHYE